MSSLERDGFVVIRGLLDMVEAQEYRRKIQSLSAVTGDDGGRRQFECPDGVSRNRSFWPLICHEPLITEYLSYSPENQHARDHIGYYRRFRDDLAYTALNPDLEKLLRAKDLFMEAPPPEKIDGFFVNRSNLAESK